MVAAFVVAACSSDGSSAASDAVSGTVETLTAEPAGAPTAVIDGRQDCLGKNAPKPAAPGAMELTGYVRTLADPSATKQPPPAKVTAFTKDGAQLGVSFADIEKSGRVSVSIPVKAEGFTGYALVAYTGFLDWRFQTSRAVTDTDLTAWAWLTTPDEAKSRATALGLTIDETKGILVGAIHDCDEWGVQNVVVTTSSQDKVFYVEGFDLSKDRTFTSETGRFVFANVAPGTVKVKAFGRLKAGGPLTLLASIEAVVEAGKMTAVGLQPRDGLE